MGLVCLIAASFAGLGSTAASDDGIQANLNTAGTSLADSSALRANTPATGGYVMGLLSANATSQAVVAYLNTVDPDDVQATAMLIEAPAPRSYIAIVFGGLALLLIIQRRKNTIA